MIIKVKTLVFCENFFEYGDVHVMFCCDTSRTKTARPTSGELNGILFHGTCTSVQHEPPHQITRSLVFGIVDQASLKPETSLFKQIEPKALISLCRCTCSLICVFIVPNRLNQLF